MSPFQVNHVVYCFTVKVTALLKVVADISHAIAYLGFSFCCSKCKKPDMFLPRRSFRYARLLQDGMGCYDGSAGNVCQVSVFLYYEVNLTYHPGVVLCSAMNASSGSVKGKITLQPVSW